MSKKKNNRTTPSPEVEQETPEVTLATAEVEPVEQVDIPVEEKTPKLVVGKITGCHSLNVREHPDIKADVLAVLSVSSEVQVDASNDYVDWYHVFTAADIDGFCMKKYIDINP